MEDKKYSKIEIQEGERKKEKLLNNLKEVNSYMEEICGEIEEGKEELKDFAGSPEEKKEMQNWVSNIELKVGSLKKDLELEKERITSINVDYDELKTEPSEPSFNNEASEIQLEIKINGPLMQIFVDYINFLNSNKKGQLKSGFVIKYIFDSDFMFEDRLANNISSYPKYDNYVLINFKNVDIMIRLHKYFQDGKFHHVINFDSKGICNLNEMYLYKKMLYNAISHSKVKGKYLIMQPGSLFWDFGMIEKRDFSDIFLPEGNQQDLQLYISLYDKTGRLLRYLMIGNPGTCKTESTIAIANLLKQKGVTIIKTSVCKVFKEKVELAELLAPSLLILDDIDLSLGSRTSGMVSSSLGDFLNILDGTEKLRKDVGIIATTNSLELLDLAAQRPGRFDKLLAFDTLEEDNVKNIILKSLRREFNIDQDSKMAQIFTNKKVVEGFHKSRVTGSHIYNAVSMLVSRIETLELDMDKITSEWVLREIITDIKTTERIRKKSYLSDKLSSGKGSDLGFSMMGDSELDESEGVDLRPTSPDRNDFTRYSIED